MIFKAAKRELRLSSNPAEGIESFDTSEHAMYTAEEPNALDAGETQRFLACMREEYPQHYAITCLAFATGLRPSSLRPLRRKGLTPDVQWDAGAILVPRSHTLGKEVMETTKSGLIGLKKKFSPRGMRRAYNDLMGAADNLVIKSISGHLTDRMKDHYSTVSPVEQAREHRSLLGLVMSETKTAEGPFGGAPTPSSGAPKGAAIH